MHTSNFYAKCPTKFQRQVPHQISARSELVVKSTSLKQGSKTTPEGSISEHLNFRQSRKHPMFFYTLTQSKLQHMPNYIQFLRHLNIFFEKSKKMAPGRLPPRR